MATTFLLIPFPAPTSFAADEISRTMKQIIDHRSDDFAAIRKDPQDAYGETDYKSTVAIPGATECYIRVEMKPRYADSCDVAESKNRALLLAKYASYDQLDRTADQADRRENLRGARPFASGGNGGLGRGGHERQLFPADGHRLRRGFRKAVAICPWKSS
jgi:hypothetical protein